MAFSEDKLRKELERAQAKHAYTLGEATKDFRLVWNHHPLSPDKDYFEFFGVPHGEHFSKSLFRRPTLNAILMTIRMYYPLMRPEDWETYRQLSDKAHDASIIRSWGNNDSTRQEEDWAIEALCAFCKDHGLPC